MELLFLVNFLLSVGVLYSLHINKKDYSIRKKDIDDKLNLLVSNQEIINEGLLNIADGINAMNGITTTGQAVEGEVDDTVGFKASYNK